MRPAGTGGDAVRRGAGAWRRVGGAQTWLRPCCPSRGEQRAAEALRGTFCPPASLITLLDGQHGCAQPMTEPAALVVAACRQRRGG